MQIECPEIIFKFRISLQIKVRIWVNARTFVFQQKLKTPHFEWDRLPILAIFVRSMPNSANNMHPGDET